MSDSGKKVDNRSRIISLILSFLLAVFMLITSATFVIYGFILSENGINGSLREANYYEGVYELIRDSVGDTLLPTGLPHSIIDDAITLDQVYADLNVYIEYMFANNTPYLQTDMIAEIVNSNIDYYLHELGLTRAEVEYGAIEEIVEAIIDEYNHYIGSPFLAYIVRVSNVFTNQLRLLILVGLVGVLVSTAIIYLVCRHSKYLTFRYFAFSFGTTALMIIVAPLALRIWGGHHGLMVRPEFIYDFIITHIERTISTLLLIGIIFIAFYLIFILISARLQKKLLQA